MHLASLEDKKEDFALFCSKDLEEALLVLINISDVRARMVFNKIIARHPDIKLNIKNVLEGGNTRMYATTHEDLKEFEQIS